MSPFVLLQVTRTIYDENGRVESVVDALGNAITQNYDLANNREIIGDKLGNETTLVFDDRGNIVQQINPLGFSVFRAFDSADNEIAFTNKRGFTTTSVYDAAGNVTSITDALDGIRQFTYDIGNNLLTETDQAGRITTNVYDVTGNLIEIINPDGHSQEWTRDSAGRVLTATDAAGFTTTFEYGRGPDPITLTNALGKSTLFTYNGFGQVTSMTDPLGRQSQVVYDNVGLPLQMIDALGGITAFTFDDEGNTTSITDPVGNVTSYEYDDAGMVIRELDPLGGESTFEYDAMGHMVIKTDRNNRQIRQIYDALGRRIREEWLANGSVASASDFTFDAVGNLLTATNGTTASNYTWDAVNRVLTDDNTGTIGVPSLILSYVYDAVGNVISRTGSDGVSVQSNYDHHRLMERIWTGPGVEPVRFEFNYDDRGLRTETRRFAGSSGTTLVARTVDGYDALGRLASRDHLFATDAAFMEFDWLFDEAGQLTQQTDRGVTASYSYDATGQLTDVVRSNGQNELYRYDLNGNRTQSHRHGTGYITGPGNRLLSDGTFNYAYDAEGNQIRKTEIATGIRTEFTYNHRNRMISAVRYSATNDVSQSVEYSYDVFGRKFQVTLDSDGVQPNAPDTQTTLFDGLHAWADYNQSATVITHYLFGSDIDELLARSTTLPGESTTFYLHSNIGTIAGIVTTAGTIIRDTSYDSFGNVLQEAGNADRFGFQGRENDAATGLSDFRSRQYSPDTGRFVTQDAIGFRSGDPSLYRFVLNQPMHFSDPSGNTAISEYAVAVVGSLALGLAIDAGVRWKCLSIGATRNAPDVGISKEDVAEGVFTEVADTLSGTGGAGLASDAVQIGDSLGTLLACFLESGFKKANRPGGVLDQRQYFRPPQEDSGCDIVCDQG